MSETIQIRDKGSTVIEIIESPEETHVNYDSPTKVDYVSEKIINKVQDLVNPNNYQYPSTKAVYDAIQDKKDKHYRHTQNENSRIWNVKHNLDKYPSITVYDTAGSVVEGAIYHVSKNEIIIEFSAPFSGYADFN